MPPLHVDRDRRGLLGVLATASVLLCLLPAHAASDRNEDIVLRKVTNLSFSLNLGTVSGADVEVIQGSTLLKASKAEAANVLDGKYDNSTWKLSGEVHLEFNGAVLDTQSATVVFASGRLDTIRAAPASAQSSQQKKTPVHFELKGAVLDSQTATVTFANGRMKNVQTQGSQGLPAQFSHQFKAASQRIHGRAGRIDYDAGKELVTFSGDTSVSHGNDEFETPSGTYSIPDGVFQGQGQSNAIIRSDERVPAPRTPDRASAK